MKKLITPLAVLVILCAVGSAQNKQKESAKKQTMLGAIKNAMDAEGYTPAYLLRTGTKNEVWIYISNLPNTSEYRVYVGPMERMIRVAAEVEMLRDGGTLDISMSKRGQLIIPDGINNADEHPTLRGKFVVRMIPKKFKITENGKTATAEDL